MELLVGQPSGRSSEDGIFCMENNPYESGTCLLNSCLLVICLMSVWMALYCVTVQKWKVWRDFKLFQCGKLMLPLEAALVDTGDILTMFELNNCGVSLWIS